MNKFEAERRFAQRMKDNYPPGTRIMLLQMGDDPRPIEPNTRGTVAVVDDMGTLHCNFDNGRQLGIVPGEDSFRRLTDQELAEEKDSQKRQLTEMSEDELYKRNIFRFDSFDDFFDFIYDENTDKADIINEMSQQMKRQLVSENYGERFIEADGAFYYTLAGTMNMDKLRNIPVESEEIFLRQRTDIRRDEWELGKAAWRNIRDFGAPTWYDWCISNWGTKWNAYGYGVTWILL